MMLSFSRKGFGPSCPSTTDIITRSRVRSSRISRQVTTRALRGLIFDCDGVILESSELHRQAYNDTFQHFNLRDGEGPIKWSAEFHSMMEDKVGLGFKTKLKWSFEEGGWPMSSLNEGRIPRSEEDRAALLDTLQEWKSKRYQEMFISGETEARPGVLRLMDEAREAGIKLAVCSAATKSTVEFSLRRLLGEGRFSALDCFLAGDDMPSKKPDPMIYTLAAEKLGLRPEECVVVEDSNIGLEAARGAGMRCIITYTEATKDQSFPGAERIVQSLGVAPAMVTVSELQGQRIVQDDRIEMTMTDDGVFFHIPGQ